MVFIDRHKELAFLNGLLTRKRPSPTQMVLMYGRAVSWFCQRLEHSREWVYKRWNHYQLERASGLRDRLMRHQAPRERYRLAGAVTIRHELACPGLG